MRAYPTIISAIQSHALSHGNALAVYASNTKLTYTELDRAVKGFARYLAALGLKRGDRVVIQAQQSVGFVVAHFGTHLAGGIFTPLDQGSSAAAILDIIRRTSAFLVITPMQIGEQHWLDSAGIISKADEYADDPAELLLPEPGEPAELLFTSGSTGSPKGVLCSHTNVVAVAENLTTGMEYEKDTLLVVPVPLNHANGIRKVSASFLNGSGVVILNGMTDISGLFKIMGEFPVTALCLPPSAVHMLLVLTGDAISKYAGQIKFVESGTAPLPEQDKLRLCELLPFSRLYNSYGLTEAGSSCMYDYNRYRGLKGCIGKPMVNSRFVVVDDDRREMISSPDNPGILAITGDSVMMRYWDDTELTGQVLSNGVFYTTDVGYFKDGMIFVIGRNDDMINVGGLKVSPAEIEDAAMCCPDVEDCACIKVNDRIAGEVPKLFVVLKPGLSDPQCIAAELKNRLESFKVPRQIVRIDSIPRSSVGKKQRSKLI